MKKLEKEVEIQKLEWWIKKYLQVRKTATNQKDSPRWCNFRKQSPGLGILMRMKHRIYPEDHSRKPQQWLKDCPAWSHGTRRGIFSGPCFDLGRVSSLTVTPSILSSCHSCLLQTLLGEMTPVQNPVQHLESRLWPLALLHSAANTAGTTREFRLWAEKIFPRKAEQDLITASPFIHFLLVIH